MGALDKNIYLVENVRFGKSSSMESSWNPYMVWTATSRTVAQEETYMPTLWHTLLITIMTSNCFMAYDMLITRLISVSGAVTDSAV